MRKNKPEHDIAVKAVCDTIGYSGVLTCLLKIAEDNHRDSEWRTEQIKGRHVKQIKILKKALKRVNRNNAAVNMILYGTEISPD